MDYYNINHEFDGIPTITDEVMVGQNCLQFKP